MRRSPTTREQHFVRTNQPHGQGANKPVMTGKKKGVGVMIGG